MPRTDPVVGGDEMSTEQVTSGNQGGGGPCEAGLQRICRRCTVAAGTARAGGVWVQVGGYESQRFACVNGGSHPWLHARPRGLLVVAVGDDVVEVVRHGEI